jgi:class 3 adenylate cyclase
MVLGIVMLAVFGILDFYLVPLAAKQIAFIRFGIAIPFVGFGLLLSYTRFYRPIMPVANASMVLVAGFSILAMIVVAERPGRDFYYAGLILVIMFAYTIIRLRFVAATVLCWFLVAAYEYAAIVLLETPIPILVNNNFFFIAANVIGMFAAYMLEFYERRDFLQARQLEEQREEIARERERAEELLYAILPRSVAARLQRHQQVADSFADVTVLFADIADFSSLTPQLPPGKLVSLLNAVFTGFDVLAEKHGLEKVKTIGDAYMAVAGLPAEREDHAEAMAEFALDMLAEIKRHRIDGLEPLNIRIGINTGPVVAGVIGRKKFIYDLWGDTVNLASRMQELGLPGQIHVTTATYQRLRRRYVFEELRHVPIKGAGELSVYTLIGRRPEAGTVISSG